VNKQTGTILGLAGAGLVGISLVIAKSRQSTELTIPALEENPTAAIVTYACQSCGYSFVGYQEAEGVEVFCPRCGGLMTGACYRRFSHTDSCLVLASLAV
jgi:DNA-directed RNA polymerase subunit RPC12/RpoP